MNVTLRPDGVPDVYVRSTDGDSCDLDKLDMYIRALQVARAWLIAEQNRRKTAKP